MKTKTILKTLALAMLMPAMLLTTACSSDDDAIINNNETPAKKGYTLPVTINVTRQSEAATRATYTDNGNKTGSLAFSTGDKLFVTGAWEDDDENCYFYAGILDYVSDGTFSGTIMTQTEWTGTTEGLLGGASATLLPAGYEEYGYLSIMDEGTYEAYLVNNYGKTFAPSKTTAVEQFSWESTQKYSSGFALTPSNAILNFTINGLDASTEVDVSFSYPNYPNPIVISGKVKTDGDGTATFAIGIIYRDNLNDCTLTVGGNAITLPADKEVEAGKIYNISRSVAPAAAVPVTSITLNKTETSIEVGSTETLSVTAVAPDNATDKTYTWKTSDASIATVDQDGKVTAVAAGTVTIYAEANDGSGVKGNCTCTVTATPAISFNKVSWYNVENAPANFISVSQTAAKAAADAEKTNADAPGYVCIYALEGGQYKWIDSHGRTGQNSDIEEIAQTDAWDEVFECADNGDDYCIWFTVSQ